MCFNCWVFKDILLTKYYSAKTFGMFRQYSIGTISHFGFIYAELIMIYKLSMIWTNIVLAYLPVSGRSGRVYDTIQL